MKRNAIIRIVLYSLAVLILGSILGVALAADYYSFSPSSFWQEADGIFMEGASEAPKAVENDICYSVIDPSGLSGIDIEWAAGAINIVPDANATQITVAEPAMAEADEQMICTVSGSTLKIKFSQEDLDWIGMNYDYSKDLSIIVPLDWVCRELEFDVASANVNIYNMTIGTVDFDGASGVCAFTDCTVSELDVDTASGDIQFTGSLDSLDCDAMSANCQLSLTNHPRHIEVSSMSGDLLLVLPEDCGFTLGMDALSSDFTTDFQTTSSNGHHVHGDGSCRINVDAMSGDVAIYKDTGHHEDTHH